MPESPSLDFLAQRDGISQALRYLENLDPAAVALDDRSLVDWLEFAHRFASRLPWIEAEGPTAGTWSKFLNFTPAELAELLGVLRTGTTVVPERHGRFTRPHVVLLIAFLHALRSSQDQVNAFTRRHLDFFFREILRFAPRPATADHLHAVVRLAGDVEQQLLPAGSRLAAGKDSAGNELEFRTDQDLVASSARLTDLRTCYLQRRVVGPVEVRENPEILIGRIVANPPWWHLDIANPDKPFLALLDLTLRDPRTNVAALTYPSARGGEAPVTPETLRDLDAVLRCVTEELRLPIPIFQSLMALKRSWDLTEPAAQVRWNQVNGALTAAGITKRGQPNYQLPSAPPDDFPTNLANALALPAKAFDGLPEVEDIYGLYRHLDDLDPQLLDPFLRERIFLAKEEFRSMMKIVEDHYRAWRQIHETLREAGRRKRPDHKEVPFDLRAYQADRLPLLIAHHLDRVTLPTVRDRVLANVEQVYDELRLLQERFQVSAEDFRRLRTFIGHPGARESELRQADEILRAAQVAQAATRRQRELGEAFGPPGTVDLGAGFEAMLRYAVGDPNPGDPLPQGRTFANLSSNRDGDYLREHLFLTPEDFGSLKRVAAEPLYRPGAVHPPLAPADWDLVFRILDQAQRKKRGAAELRLEVEYIENVFAASEARRVTAGLPSSDPSATPRWRAFGDGFRADGATTPGSLGFLFSSPVLALAEGTRKISVAITFDPRSVDRPAVEKVLTEQEPRPPWRFQVTTAKGWVEVPAIPETTGGPRIRWLSADAGSPWAGAPVMRFTLLLEAAQPAVVTPGPEWGVPTGSPALAVLLVDHLEAAGAAPTKSYAALRSLRAVQASVTVQVEGLVSLAVQNDDSLLDARKPFEPFGSLPATGARFRFAHPELCAKRLDQFALGIDWLGAPSDLKAHYAHYSAKGSSPITDASSFKADLILWDRNTRYGTATVELFGPPKAPNRLSVTEPSSLESGIDATRKAAPHYDRLLDLTTSEEPLGWNRCWLLELKSPDFQHSIYPAAAARRVSDLDDASPPKPIILNPPYTPKIKSLRAYYRSSVEFDLTRPSTPTDSFFHVLPFGFSRPGPEGENPGTPLLAPLEDDGELLLGFEALVPPQNLSVLFQTAPGSANPEATATPIRWSCRSGNAWISLDRGSVISDTTSNLLNSGIITFALPKVAPALGLASDRFWLRATLSRQVRSVADLVDIRPHAVRATFVANPEAVRVSPVLPAGSVLGLVEPISGIAEVQQPYSSMGGSRAEEARPFQLRASERIRHKNRALTPWDFERLVLQEFPEVYKVKCLSLDASADSLEAREVRVILIPNIRGQVPFDPFEPKVSAETLRAVESFLGQRTSPLARVRVQNPRYAVLQLRFSVRLRPGYNPGFYLPRLDEELRRFLAPWAYDESADIVLAGQINSSLIVHFIETRPYVDFMAALSLFLGDERHAPRPITEPELNQRAADQDGIDWILVSARQHVIDLIEDEVVVDETFVGINHMKVELDFQIASEATA